MPLEVAQWLTDRHNRSASTASEHSYSEFGPDGDAEQLASLSPSQLFGRMLGERDLRTRIQRQVATSQPELAELAGETPVYRYNIIGEVRDDVLAYVIYSYGDPKRSGTTSVLVLKPTKEGWCV